MHPVLVRKNPDGLIIPSHVDEESVSAGIMDRAAEIIFFAEEGTAFGAFLG
jgi:hypothetical protein